jgi:hypothetical protein
MFYNRFITGTEISNFYFDIDNLNWNPLLKKENNLPCGYEKANGRPTLGYYHVSTHKVGVEYIDTHVGRCFLISPLIFSTFPFTISILNK